MGEEKERSRGEKERIRGGENEKWGRKKKELGQEKEVGKRNKEMGRRKKQVGEEKEINLEATRYSSLGVIILSVVKAKEKYTSQQRSPTSPLFRQKWTISTISFVDI